MEASAVEVINIIVAKISSPDDYPALSPLFSTIELLIPLGAEFNALSPHKLWESVGDSIW